jgi:diphthine synthase
MLSFVGLGIAGPDSLSEKARQVISGAEIVYLEQFTSPMSESDVQKIKQMTKGAFKFAPRWLVEDGGEILQNAQKRNVAFLSFGDPYIATTHIELRVRAMRQKIQTETVHASSAVTALVGECGLHYYKMGRTVTIMSNIPATTAYYTIFENLKLGNHTVVLLEYNQDKKFFLKPAAALSSLIDAEKEQSRKVLSESTFVVVASRVGLDTQKIVAGKISSLANFDFGDPPHSIVIPGSLHFTESEAIEVLAERLDAPADNSAKIEKIATQMIKKYVPMVREALGRIAPLYQEAPEFAEVLQNAELYIRDAERFFEQGKDELAVLSIGYADGLVDALRIAKGIEPQIE